MFISAFPGTGKSWLTNNFPELFLDLDSGLFNKLPDGRKNPNFVEDYINAILEHQNCGKHVFVSTHHEVIKALEDNGVEFVVIVPALELEQSYMKRYRKRGSPPDFIQKIHDNWVSYISPLLERDNTIVLREGQFVSDVVEMGHLFDPLSVKLRRLKDGE